MSVINEVERIYQEFKELHVQLSSSNTGPYFITIVASHDAKILLVSAASYYERLVCERIEQIYKQTIINKDCLISFISTQALKRKFYTMFDFHTNNTNKFFSLFGNSFKNYISAKINGDETYAEGMKNFMNICRERNNMVHENYATYSLNYTLDEVMKQFQSGLEFLERVFSELSGFIEPSSPAL